MVVRSAAKINGTRRNTHTLNEMHVFELYYNAGGCSVRIFWLWDFVFMRIFLLVQSCRYKRMEYTHVVNCRYIRVDSFITMPVGVP